jgi:hypothetical protein
MSVSIHSLFTLRELALELEWFEARDMLLRDNFVKQDVKRAVELAAASNHPQCQWLTSLFADKVVKTTEDACDVFLADEKKSSASLCFAALLSRPVNEAFLRQSAELGCPLAQAKMAKNTTRSEMFQFAKASSSQRERDGFYWLGIGCEKDLEKAKEFLLVSAQLGQVSSMSSFAVLMNFSDPQRWIWAGRAAVLGDPNGFLCWFTIHVQKLNAGSGNGALVFLIGKSLNGRVCVEERTIFGKDWFFGERIGPANSAISFYKSQLTACRRAADIWSHVGIRCGVVKDIRVLIGKLVWESRDLALFKV